MSTVPMKACKIFSIITGIAKVKIVVISSLFFNKYNITLTPPYPPGGLLKL